MKNVRRERERVRREMRKWRREGGNGDRYREEKGSYKKLCEDLPQRIRRERGEEGGYRNGGLE